MCGSVYKDFGCILCFLVQCDAFIFSNLVRNRFCRSWQPSGLLFIILRLILLECLLTWSLLLKYLGSWTRTAKSEGSQLKPRLDGDIMHISERSIVPPISLELMILAMNLCLWISYQLQLQILWCQEERGISRTEKLLLKVNYILNILTIAVIMVIFPVPLLWLLPGNSPLLRPDIVSSISQ